MHRWDARIHIIRDISAEELCEFSDIVWKKKKEVEFSWNSVYDAIQSKSTSCPLTSRMQPAQLQQVWTALFITRSRNPSDDAEADKLVNLFVSCCNCSTYHIISPSFCLNH